MKLKVIQIIERSPTIKTFCLEPLGEYKKYMAGQYLTIHTGAEKDVHRAYSLSSTPTEPGSYEITVKVIEDGIGSGWMHNEVKVDDVLDADEPAGKFTLQQAALSSVFLAGGIGVTPLLSHLKYALASGDTRKLYFFYASRHVIDLVFHEEIAELAKKYDNLVYVPIISGDVNEAWDGLRGRVTKDLLFENGVIFKRAEFYTCGPESFMDAVLKMCAEEKISKSNFHKEAFLVENDESDNLGPFKINYKGDEYVYKGNKSLLDFLHGEKVRVRHSCKSGICGSCEVKVESGQVKHLNEDFFNEQELAEGKRLACVAFPQSDLVVSKHN
jgi:ferredoxin-NADP reductase